MIIPINSRNIFILLIPFFLHACEQREFIEIAAVETGVPSDILATSVKLEGKILDMGSGIESYGHCWALAQKPTVEDNSNNHGAMSSSQSFVSEISGLESRSAISQTNSRISGQTGLARQ